MKTSTKFQFRIQELAKTLKPLSMAHKNWAIDKCINHVATVNSKGIITCLACNHIFKDDYKGIKKHKCPNCKKSIIKNQTRNLIFLDDAICMIYDTCKDFQVLRYCIVEAYFKKGKEAFYSFEEVCQIWINQNGKYEIYSKLHILNFYMNVWKGDFEFRNKKTLDKYDLKPYKIYTKHKLIPEIQRLNFKHKNIRLSPLTSILRILNIPCFETLYKSSQFDLFNYSNVDRITKYWKSIKICIRNIYTIYDESIWFDYLNLLEYFNKDILNTKYICPIDLHKEHDKLVNKKNEIFRKQELKKQIEKIEIEQESYLINKSKYLDITIVKDDILIQPIKSVQDFFEIGSSQNHCIFSNEYYKKDNSLILVAYRNGEILETIEISLKDYRILQSRGRNNKETKEHDKIISIVNKNIDKIKYIKAS